MTPSQPTNATRAVVALGLTLGAVALFGPAQAVAAPGPQDLCAQSTQQTSGGVQFIKVVCQYTGAPQYWQAPSALPGDVDVTAFGAQGGNSLCTGPISPPDNYCTFGGGAAGATVTAALSGGLDPAALYQVQVGGRGPDGALYWLDTPGGYNGGGGSAYDWSSQTQNGGGGGGATDLRAAPYGLSDRVVVAGGGGGAGGGGDGNGMGYGGPGGLNGVDGQDGVGDGPYAPPPGSAGQGGTQSAGGAGGLLNTEYDANSGTAPGEPGSLGQGGSGPRRGGGGGGGYYGGGSGNGPDGGGGGGGSSLAPAGATVTTGTNGGAGLMVITYASYQDPPECENAMGDTDQNAVDVTVTCVDPTGQLLLQGISIASQPAQGTATVSDPSGVITYTPDPGSSGTDYFTFRDTSANGDGRPATVAINSTVCTLTGTPSGDNLMGTADDDLICGLDGNDVISGNGGDDELRGDAGGDVLNGGPGSDTITDTESVSTPRTAGARKGNTVEAGTGNDRVKAANGIKDRIDCGQGANDRATVDRFDRVKHCERVTH